jgi:hypothetical protein
MSYMQPEILGPMTWVQLDEHWYPLESGNPADSDYQLAAQCAEEYSLGYASDMENIDVARESWGARMQSPGYMDATEWTVAATERDAIVTLCEYHDALLCPRCGLCYATPAEYLGSTDLDLSDTTTWPCLDCRDELPEVAARTVESLRARLSRGPVDGTAAMAMSDALRGVLGMLASLHPDIELGEPEDIPEKGINSDSSLVGQCVERGAA